VRGISARLPQVALVRASFGRVWSNRWARAGINTAAGLILLLLVVRSVPLGSALAHAEPRHLSPLFGLLAFTILSQLARAVRLKLLLRPQRRVGLLQALWINLATQLVNYTVPLRAGEGLRLWWLNARQQLPIGAGLGLLVIDHTFDLGGITAVLSAGTVLKAMSVVPALPALPALLVVLGLAVGTLTTIAALVVLGPHLAASPLAERWLRPSWRVWLVHHVATFRVGAGAARGRRRLVLMLAASAIAVALDGLAFAMIFRALGLSVPVVSAIVTQVMILYAYLIPSAPGYVGSLEAGGTLLLGSIGLSRGAAAGAIVLWHALGAMLIVGLGLIAIYQLRRGGPIRGRPTR
jgi:uncharacterized protein (TIRG00374 family)